VREALVDRQRELAAGGGMVMVGRDIGTVVLPGADLKLYLTASTEERARRRTRELEDRGQPASYDAILADMRRRDAFDSGRAASPLRPAPDAVGVDGDRLTVEDEVALAVKLLERRARGCTSGDVPGDHGDNGASAGDTGSAAHRRREP
jgi:cytidylate kinase